MTGAEWLRVADEVEALWGKTAAWRKADEAYKYAAKVPVAAAFAAIEDIYLEAKDRPPSPAQVLGRAKQKIEGTATVDEARRYCDRERHLFGIIAEQNGIRTGVCGRCGYVDQRPAHLLPTEGEIDDGVYSGRADDLTERIAP